MASEDRDKPPKVDEAMLRAFARGQLDEAAEDRVLALLEEKPELQAKVAAVSIDPVLQKMRAHSQVLARRSLSSQLGKAKNEAVEPPTPSAAPVDIPQELEALSEFRVLKELGRGGMGVVYLAENKWMGGRKEVLKVLNERLIGNEDAKTRFQKEIEITAQLDHPAIVKSHSVRPLESVIVFSMEHVKGKNLHEFIAANGKLPAPVACSIASDVCGGLQHAMKKGAIHRDIKPSNLMLYKSDGGRIRAKILDFGLARATTTDRSQGLTEDGTLLGTLEYIAPEQSLDANKVDIRADIYSLGCTLYHMLVGHPPFSGTAGQLILAHSQTVPPSPHLIQPTVPVELANVVLRMLAKQPERRFQTPDEVAVALRPFLKKGSASPAAAPSLEQTPAPETAGPDIEALRDTSVEIARVTAQDGLDSDTPTVEYLGEREPVIPAFATPTYKSRRRKKQTGLQRFLVSPYFLGVSAMLVLIACLALATMEVKTPNGTIVVENLPENASVFVDGDEVEVRWEGKIAFIQAKAGERKVEVRLGDTVVEGETVAVQGDAKTNLVVSAKAAQLDNSETDLAQELEKKQASSESAIPPEAVEFNGHRYLRIDKRFTHAEASALAESMGGILVRIQSQKENQFVVNLCKSHALPGDAKFWIDGSDEIKNRTWRFGDGSPMPYFSWARGEPNDFRGREDHVVIHAGKRFRWEDVRKNGKYGLVVEWGGEHPASVANQKKLVRIADFPAADASEIPEDAVEFNGRRFKVFVEQVSWTEAQAKCAELGGRLALITSEEDNQLVFDLARKQEAIDAVWIGASDHVTEGAWVGSDGKPLAWSKWGPTQPNNKGGGEHYALLVTRFSNPKYLGAWSDQPEVANQHKPGFVCEWPAATQSLAANQQGGVWEDLLGLVDVREHVMKGRVLSRSGSSIICGASRSTHPKRFMIPYAIEGGYDIEMEFTRKSGSHDVALILPVGESNAELILSAHDNTVSGIGVVSGVWMKDRHGVNSGTYRGHTVGNGHRHRVRVEVRPRSDSVSIVALLDDKQLFSWSGFADQLALRPGLALPSHACPGVWVLWDHVEIHSIKARPLPAGRGMPLAKGDWGHPFYQVANAPPAEVAAKCVEWNSKQYYISDEPLDLPAAQRLAAKLKGRLLTISSAEEHQAIDKLRSGRKLAMAGWRPHHSDIWRDERNRPLRYTGGWIKASNEPNNFKGLQRFMVFDSKEGGGWNDLALVDAARGHHACIEWGEEYPTRSATRALSEPKPKWQSLFDGRTLAGWSRRQGSAVFTVEHEQIVGRTNQPHANSFLCTDRSFTDFELTFETRVRNGNSGLQFRSQTNPEYKNGKVHGPQVEIEQSPGLSGYIYSEGTGRHWVSRDYPIQSAFKNNGWNRYRVVAQGDWIRTWVNNQLIVDMRDPASNNSGFFALQVHSDKGVSGPFEMRWRNIKIRELNK